MEVRKCCGCGKTHPLTKEFFYISRKEKTGYIYRCKVCMRQKGLGKRLEKRLNSERYKVKMREDATGLRECKICGTEKALSLFNLNTRTLADGTRNAYRKGECSLCRQFKRNGGRPSKPKIRPSQILVEVGGKTCKQCTTCRESKKLQAFSKSKNTLTGFAHYCKKCACERKRKDYVMRPETRIAKRAWDARNVEKVREQDIIRGKRYRAKPEKRELLAKARGRWVAKNPEKVEAASKKRAGELTDAYVRYLLCAGGGGKHIPKSQWPEIPPQLIEVKRAQLKLLHRIKGRG